MVVKPRDLEHRVEGVEGGARPEPRALLWTNVVCGTSRVMRVVGDWCSGERKEWSICVWLWRMK